MTTPADPHDTPLPAIPRPQDTTHPVYAALLGELAERAAAGEPVCAQYEDAP
ncbi:hypothetical protein ACQB60_42020 [Actinomycetota bacterium Odt1-20B]